MNELRWDGEKLTRKHAALLCWKMWEWMAGYVTQERMDELRGEYGSAASNGIFKYEWPERTKNGGEVNELRNKCPACEYTFNTLGNDEDCDDCFLIHVWPTGCMEDKSPYVHFVSAKIAEEAVKHANTIAMAAKAVYDEEVGEDDDAG